jgi:hypothetical protein
MGQHMGNKNNITINSEGVLNIYSLNYDTMIFIHKLVIFLKGKSCSLNPTSFQYISLEGVKNLIIKNSSTGIESPLKLLHLHYIDADNVQNNIDQKLFKSDEPIKNHTHMFCTLNNSQLSIDLAKFNIHPSSTATIIHHDMDTFNWEIIQTCDI